MTLLGDLDDIAASLEDVGLRLPDSREVMATRLRAAAARIREEMARVTGPGNSDALDAVFDRELALLERINGGQQ